MTNETIKKGGISVDTAHIFPIIKKWLYSEKDIFLRELVSNATDAITKLKRLQSLGEAKATDEPFAITVTLDRVAKTLTVEDNGIGIDPEEIEKRSAQAAQRALDPSVAKPEGKSSVGLYYVKERMKMWSENSTFSIHCQDVTRVEIRIPWEVIDNESSDR